MSTQWYYQVLGEELGPCSAAELRHLAQRKAIEPDTLVRKEDSKWVTASSVKGLLPVRRTAETAVSEASRSPRDTPLRETRGSAGSEGTTKVDLQNAALNKDEPTTSQPEGSLTFIPGAANKHFPLKLVVSAFACIALLASLILAAWQAGPTQRFQKAFAVLSDFNMYPGSSEKVAVGEVFDLIYEIREKAATSNITHAAVVRGTKSSPRSAASSGVTEFELHYQYPDQSGGSGWQLLLEKSTITPAALGVPVSLALNQAKPDRKMI